MEKKQNYVTWIQPPLTFIWKKDIYSDIAKVFETRFDTSNHQLNRTLSKGKTKKVIGLMKVELGGENNFKVHRIESKNV